MIETVRRQPTVGDAEHELLRMTRLMSMP